MQDRCKTTFFTTILQPSKGVEMLKEGDELSLKMNQITLNGCVAQLVEQRSPKPPVGGSNPSALELLERINLRVLKRCQHQSP